jgi:ABC-type Fe3+ transport system permease subunit
MTNLRLFFAILLSIFIGVPILLPFVECLSLGDPAWLWTESDYLWQLTASTLLLVGGTLAVSVPVGTLLAVLLFRTDLPGRRFWIGATLLVLFVPLPMLMSAWYALLGDGGFYPLEGWEINLGRDLTRGLIPAIWVHSVAGIPWVVLIVGNGLCWIERELEEDAMLHAGPWRVLWRVTLPRCTGSLAAAALWLGLATYAEIGVTYFLQVPTLAEEVHTQFASANPAALARSLMLSLPLVLCLVGLLLWQAPRLERSLPPLQGWLAAPRSFPLGLGRWPWALALAGVAAVLVLLPLASLVWKVGLAGAPRAWSLHEAWTRLGSESRVALPTVLGSFLIAVATGLLTTFMGLFCCWLARDCRWFAGFLLVLMILAWSLPGPVIGIGLKELILRLPGRTLEALLYRGPSPLPVMWAQAIRFLPVATALLWPWVRTVPRELLDSARMDGAGPLQELIRVTGPMAAPILGWTTLVLTALCLGEVAASNRVDTPGSETFAKILLDRMHYGVDNTVAALCLIQLACLLVLLVFPAVGGRIVIALRRN